MVYTAVACYRVQGEKSGLNLNWVGSTLSLAIRLLEMK